MNKSELNIKKYKAIELYQMILKNQLNQFPKKYWVLQDAYINAADVTNYMINNILHWNDEDIRNKLNKSTFHNNKLGGMLKTLFNNNYYPAIDNARPGLFRKWEFKSSSVGNDFWNKDIAIEAIKWSIEEKLKVDFERLPNEIIKQTFVENNLGGMLTQLFNNSPYSAINAAYPGKYTQKQFKRNRRSHHIHYS